jgi:phage gp29-like protein
MDVKLVPPPDNLVASLSSTGTRIGSVDVSLDAPTAIAPFNDRYQITLGSAISPRHVTNALNLANIGWMYQLADLLDEMRATDTHLHSVLYKAEWEVAGADWEIHPEEDVDPQAAEIARWCATTLRAIPHLADNFAHLQAAHYNGYAVIENIWGWVARRYVPIRFSRLHPRRFAYATDWRLHLWDQTGNEAAPDLARFPGLALDATPYGKFIVHQPRVRGGYPTREGNGRVLVWYSLFKRTAWRDIMGLCEWAGRGIRLATWQTGQGKDQARATPEDVAELEKAVDRMSSAMAAVFPDTTKIQVLPVPHDNTIHTAIMNAANAEQSKTVLGNTLTTEAGTRGARSLGDNHSDEQAMLRRGRAQSLGETIRWGWLAPMVRYNFGPHAAVPIFRFKVDAEESLNDLAKRTAILVSAGVQHTQAWAQETFGLPKPRDGEALITPAAVRADTDPTVAPVQQAPGSGDAGEVKA